MRKVYIYWLITVSIVVVIAGIIFAFIAPYFIPSIQDIIYQSFNDQSLQRINIIDKNHINWIYGVLGGTLAGWGMMILFMSISLLKENNKIIWNSILVSIITWFIIDTIITFKYMVIPNLVLNIAILIAVMIPYIRNSNKSQKT